MLYNSPTKSDSELSLVSDSSCSSPSDVLDYSTRASTPHDGTAFFKDSLLSQNLQSSEKEEFINERTNELTSEKNIDKASKRFAGSKEMSNLLDAWSYDPACEYSLPKSYLRASRKRKTDEYEAELAQEEAILAAKRAQNAAKRKTSVQQQKQDLKEQKRAAMEEKKLAMEQKKLALQEKKLAAREKKLTAQAKKLAAQEKALLKLALKNESKALKIASAGVNGAPKPKRKYKKKQKIEAPVEPIEKPLSGTPELEKSATPVRAKLENALHLNSKDESDLDSQLTAFIEDTPLHVLSNTFWVDAKQGFSATELGSFISSRNVSKLPETCEEISIVVSPLYPEYKEVFQVDFSQRKEKLMVYHPMLEIGKLLHYNTVVYFHGEEQDHLLHDIVQPLFQAFLNEDASLFLKKIKEYNAYVERCDTNMLFQNLSQVKEVPLGWIHFILGMVYTRSIIPDAKKLKNYRAFSNFVYGELMPSLLSKSYKQCNMSNESVFMDLGSGVGNCVLQAALEYNCKLSYGIEIMEEPSKLTELQVTQTTLYSKLFGINLGKLDFSLQESFVGNPKTIEYMRKCDVLLINNFIFDSALNLEIEKLIQNCKVGCKIITLKTLRPYGFVIDGDDKLSNILSRLKISKYKLPSDSVSWTHRGCGDYFISEVTDRIDEELLTFRAKSRRSEKPVDYNIKKQYELLSKDLF
ncbi:hypothetical protein ACO0QE_000715 [Hanseniaspora vineae]